MFLFSFGICQPLALRHRLCHLLLCSMPALCPPSTGRAALEAQTRTPPQNLVGRSRPNPTEHASTKRSGNTRRLMFNPCVEGFFTAPKGAEDWKTDSKIDVNQSPMCNRYWLVVPNIFYFSQYMGLSFPLTNSYVSYVGYY